jgi:NAD(P)-dependent dehydrogenase (short-subunit alcohol dehydrogenase family)
MSRFEGKLALVTGAGSGIGEAIVRRLVRDGARVIATDVSGKQDGLAAELGEMVVSRHLDVSREDEVQALEQWLRAEYRGLDMLFNNAGIASAIAPLHEQTMAEFDRVLGVNVRGAYMVLQAGLRLMLESDGGAIVNTASIGGFRGTPGASPYICSKGAMVMMTRVAAIEYAGQGIRVNAVGPGTTHTAILEGAPPGFVDMLAGQVPQGRLGTAAEMANVACFLADDAEASHVTGQIVVVDGGRSAG